MMFLLLSLFACENETPAPPPAPPPAVTPPPVAAAPEGPRVPATSRMAASHVLVSYAGAVGVLPNVTRTKEEAKARAEEARTRILAGEDFSNVAQAYSDDSSASKGGSLGGFNSGVFVPAFEETVRKLQVGQVSTVVETPFGFHVIRRDAVTEVHASMLLISWKGAERAPDGVSRSKEEAKTRMAEAQKALSEGQKWPEVVRKFSDGPLAEQGGDLGWFSKGQLFEPLNSAAFNLDIGATSTVLESPRGYYLLMRDE